MDAVWKKQDHAPKTLKKVAIIAVNKNLEAKQSLEQDIIEKLKEVHLNIEICNGHFLISS